MEESNGEEAPTPSSFCSFLSLPDDIVLYCLALIPTSYYPKLSLVSKSFRSLISSTDLVNARYRFNTKEYCVFLRLKLPTRYHPSLFSLWSNTKTGKKLLVPAPSSFTPRLPNFPMTVGSELYFFDRRHNTPSSFLWVIRNTRNNHKNLVTTPSMMVARVNPLVMMDRHEKIYVVGGCEPDESTNWAQVFDTKTQTWESLPDHDFDLRFSSIKKIHIFKDSLYVISDDKKKHYVYHPKERRWDVTETRLSDSMCIIDNVLYRCVDNECYWLNRKLELLKRVKGLDTLVITLERRYNGDDDEVWGQIEWVDVVYNVPESSTLLSCVAALI